ncbi:sulfotransferase family protein [Sphingomonas hankyongi]|uniref:Sulfotransferase n=1 Tax=Sphingomonas hankyongi TaxID=2908209 RepID=A0ABT0S2Z3_9SPHN|nr:sulfotransferase [Sphingomonas hankyongi]
MVDRPVFLVGAERSGTTMLRLMLDSHPDIAFQGEFNFLVDCVGANGELPEVQTFESVVTKDRIFRLWDLAVPPGLTFAELANYFLEQKDASKRANVLGATVHRYFDRLLHIWPAARFIHLVRDPRAVALSRVRMGWAGNIYTGIREWADVEQLWAEFVSRIPADRHISVHYERLVEQPAAELARICGFLGLNYDEDMMRYDRHSTYSLPNAQGAAKWRQLSPVVLAAAEFEVSPWLELAGYQPSQPSKRPSSLQRIAFAVQSRIAVVQFRARRYGGRLWLEDVLSRRVGSNRWRDRVRQRVHAIDNKHLK